MACLQRAAYYLFVMPWAIFTILTSILDLVAVGFFFYDLFNTLVRTNKYALISLHFHRTFNKFFSFQLWKLEYRIIRAAYANAENIHRICIAFD